MAVTLTQLCESTFQKYPVRLTAGKAGTGNIVRWVHILDDSKILPSLHGGEFIITTGAGRPDGKQLAGFVRSLEEAGAVGVMIVTGTNIPSIPDEITEYCEMNDFPLFVSPDADNILDISYELCRKITGSEKHENTVNEALKAVIGDPSALRSYHKMLTNSDFSDSGNYRAVTIYCPSAGNTAVSGDMALRRIIKSTAFRSAMFVYKGLITAIFQSATDEEIDTFCRCAADSFGDRIRIGVSDSVTGLAEISSAYERSEAALVSSVLKGKSCTQYADIGIMQLITGVKDKNVLRNFVSEQLGALFGYDREHGTDLARTLRIYLESNSSVNETAAVEKVHRNTVNSKIRMIKELLGHELDDVSKSRLIMAFLIDDVMRIYDEKLRSSKKT
ncbi:MAG: PucR family transcriptional regulator ligand-binding domain-containing protein [Ruminiclostridium sp.]|nr:PucR family transcriptional regulator ligand-binding domain-containing protein [Ruminiclostridium sp.]